MSSKNWKTLFFSAFRRQPSSNNYKYKHATPKIKSVVLNKITKDLASQDLKAVEVRLDRQLFSAPVSKVREIIFRDATGPAHARIKTIRTDPLRSPKAVRQVAVSSWQNIAPIFMHPLSPFSEFEAAGSASPFEYTCTVSLQSEDGLEKLSHVSWPNALLSNSCQGVAVLKERFDALSSVGSFVNPSDGRPLDVFVVEEVPDGCDAIGLFPAYEDSHRRFFSGLKLCAAVIRRKPCSPEQRAAVEALVTSSSRGEKDGEDAAEQSKTDSQWSSLKEVMDAASTCQSLWSHARDHDRTCPGDIIRCTLMSPKIDKNQLTEEFCKHFIFYSLLSQASRLLQTVDKSVTYRQGKLTPIDRCVWQKFQELNEVDSPTSVAEMIKYKQDFDEFSTLLSSYYFSIVAEMKAFSRDFFHNDRETPRAVTVYRILFEILHNCKPFKTFYPNLSVYATKILPQNIPSVDLIRSHMHDNDGKLSLGAKALTIFKYITEFESEMYYDRLTTSKPLELEPVASLKSWKIVILAKEPLPQEIERALVFNSRVYTQCVTDLAQVTLIKFAACKVRKMIDEDTFLFLYQLQRPPKVDREELVGDVLNKLENASKEVHGI